MAAITAIAQRHGLKLIEDAAHALPASWKQRIIGCGTSDATVFSFYATKTITTGEGGMITFVDPAIAKRARTLRLHGISKDISLRNGDASGRDWRYEVVAPGFKSNMSDIVASIGIVQLGRARALYGRRAQIWARYDAGLAGLPVLRPPHAQADDSHAFHLYALRLCEEAPLDRDSFIAEMAKDGIECGVHFIPLHLHPYWRDTLV
jgi:dTDP-4-amino-4,6-dideoxygalactose transaminase